MAEGPSEPSDAPKDTLEVLLKELEEEAKKGSDKLKCLVQDLIKDLKERADPERINKIMKNMSDEIKEDTTKTGDKMKDKYEEIETHLKNNMAVLKEKSREAQEMFYSKMQAILTNFQATYKEMSEEAKAQTQEALTLIKEKADPEKVKEAVAKLKNSLGVKT